MNFSFVEQLLLLFDWHTEARSATANGTSTISPKPTTTIATRCAQPGMIALTYDDGPGPYTQRLLDILEDNDVRATFFVNGNNWNGPITDPGNTQVLQEASARGHHIGSHTWSHKNLNMISEDERREEMERLADALQDILGYTPKYMRPPFFECSNDCQQDMTSWGYHIVNTNLDTKDYTGALDQSRNVFASAMAVNSPRDASFIVLVHDVHQGTVEYLTQYMIDEAKTHGYKLVTLGECLGDASVHYL